MSFNVNEVRSLLTRAVGNPQVVTTTDEAAGAASTAGERGEALRIAETVRALAVGGSQGAARVAAQAWLGQVAS